MRLAITDLGDDEYSIGWYDSEDMEGDLSLGERLPHWQDESEAESRDVDEHNDLSEAVEQLARPCQITSRGLVWQGRASARAALRCAKAVLAQLRRDAPWPEWAVTAQAAGWKAPKGWRP